MMYKPLILSAMLFSLSAFAKSTKYGCGPNTAGTGCKYISCKCKKAVPKVGDVTNGGEANVYYDCTVPTNINCGKAGDPKPNFKYAYCEDLSMMEKVEGRQVPVCCDVQSENVKAELESLNGLQGPTDPAKKLLEGIGGDAALNPVAVGACYPATVGEYPPPEN